MQFTTGIPVFPEVGFTGEPPSIFTTTVQTLIFGIPQKHFIDSARLGLQAASSRLIDAREQVALGASTVSTSNIDTLSQQNWPHHRQARVCRSSGREIEQKRAEAGVDPLSELLQARLTAAEIKLRLQHLEGRERTVAKQLATLTGLPLQDPSRPDRTQRFLKIPTVPAATSHRIPSKGFARRNCSRIPGSWLQKLSGRSTTCLSSVSTRSTTAIRHC